MSTWPVSGSPALPGVGLLRATTARLGRAGRVVRGAGPGLALALAVAAVATGLGRLLPVLGGPVLGILLGAPAGAVIRPGRILAPGLAVAARPLLQASIVVLGTGISLQQVVRVGLGSLPVMLGTLAVALGGGWLLGRLLGVSGDTRALVSVGTGICGASAIAAVASVIEPRRTDLAYAVGTIVTFNVAAVLLFPVVGHALAMDQAAFGLWAGTAINDTSSVVAAAVSYGPQAAQEGVVVKLTRTLMIVPVVLALALLHGRRSGGGTRRVPWRKVVPLFLVGFLLAAGAQSLGLVPAGWHDALALLGTFLLTTALAGIGLTLRFADMRAAGFRPLLLGGLLWVAVAATSLGLQAVTGAL
ncbi:putative sulfate exporter family transporter [Pseudonocardia kujensis]|uniref:YeiH family protein n=1 Tax=Pseudonocardia kujensis TaxID=1128675 RepID=UPI001E5E2C41|nr:putative sulfate exporter family transporter [Pseudonocardia kujensis]MCE0761663.1 putative sulfate exporter family transporter [Pseudonocardia kujensis]